MISQLTVCLVAEATGDLAATPLWELSAATRGYLLLYVLSFVLHAVFVGYVLPGSLYLAGVALFRSPGQGGPFEPLLRAWLPFMLSLAITAGIAPLLFLQILYRPAYYTANLLLFHRWMAVLPVLIIGFYLLYLLKIRFAEKRSRPLAVVIAATTAACFLFIAWSWSENHLLSLAGQETWAKMHVSQSVLYRSSVLLPRLGIWLGGVFPLLACWLSWQLWGTAPAAREQPVAGSREAAVLGVAGLVFSLVCGVLYWMAMPEAHRVALTRPVAMVPWALAGLAAVASLGLLSRQFFDRTPRRHRLVFLSVALLAGTGGVACLRELIRLASIDISAVASTHIDAAGVGGRWVFAAFLVINSVLVAWCLRTVVRLELNGSDGQREE